MNSVCLTRFAHSSNRSGRLSRALGRRKPCSTRVSLRLWSPANMPRSCGSVTCASSTIMRKSSGKKSTSGGVCRAKLVRDVGHCPGVENYARWFSGRKPGEPPYTLLDFFPDDFLMVVDESHATLPQVRGMFAGDHSRKLTLVEHGFRLPSALDNRPLRFDEWEKRVKQVLFMSATPGPYELEVTGGEVVEQVIRPTGLVDPMLHVRAARGQVPDLIDEIKKRAASKERVLVTTLTKRLAEDLSAYLRDAGLRGKWLHSELDAIERMQILRELREGAFDVLVGVNLLREGLDLPEVSLVAILDADKEGFLRSGTSL